MASREFSNEFVTATPAAAAVTRETKETDDNEVQKLGYELIRSELPVAQVPVVIEIKHSYALLQSSLKPLMTNDPVLQQVTRNTSGVIENIVDTIELGRIWRKRQQIFVRTYIIYHQKLLIKLTIERERCVKIY
jgi:hypothetical protein